jgi:hypothetical protein
MPKKEEQKPADTKEPQIIGYFVRPLPKRRRRLRDFRDKGADYIRSIYAYGKDMRLSAKIGCLTALVIGISLLIFLLYIAAGPGSLPFARGGG